MWIGNLMLLVLNLPMVGLWVKLLTVPYRWLFPSIVLFCAIGVFTTNNTVWDIWMVALFGFAGFIMMRLGAEMAPLLLGMVLGPMMEENLRRALTISGGKWEVFFTRPISAGLLLVSAILVIAILSPNLKKRREEAFKEDD